LFRIAELYGWTKKPNEGTKKLAVEIAKEIIAFEEKAGWRWGKKWDESRVQPGPADSSIYDAENGVCISDDMAKVGVKWTKADKSPGSRKTGWEKLRMLMRASTQFPMEAPGIFIFSNCTDGFIRTVPVLPRDKRDPDDVDTEAEDHAGDDTRYRITVVRHSGGTVRLGGL
jgi:hypothetical protein